MNDDTTYGTKRHKLLSEFTPTPILRVPGESMFYIYLLKSLKDGNLYTGYTNNLKRRVQEHNCGLVPSTKARKPFELIYFEGYKSEEDARHRERNLKLRSRAFAQLKKRIGASLI